MAEVALATIHPELLAVYSSLPEMVDWRVTNSANPNFADRELEADGLFLPRFNLSRLITLGTPADLGVQQVNVNITTPAHPNYEGRKQDYEKQESDPHFKAL